MLVLHTYRCDERVRRLQPRVPLITTPRNEKVCGTNRTAAATSHQENSTGSTGIQCTVVLDRENNHPERHPPLGLKSKKSTSTTTVISRDYRLKNEI